MTGHPIRGPVAVLAAAALTTALATSALAADPEVAARKPAVKCAGVVATKVGTPGPDTLVGTPKRDIIAGLGGNDVIYGLGGNDVLCGGSGHDRLFGGPGRDKFLGQTGRDRLRGGTARDRLFGGAHADRLFGQGGPDLLLGGPGNDRLVGGAGIDTCYQNSGQGPLLQCELPAAPVVAPAPAPPPPPAPKTLAIAYSDLVRDYRFGAGDVLIAKLVDTNGDGVPSTDDTIIMGMYPKDLAASGFYSWTATEHAVMSVDHATTTYVDVNSAAGTHQWLSTTNTEYYLEVNGSPLGSLIMDLHVSDPPNEDMVDVNLGSPGAPTTDAFDQLATIDDQRFVDVDIHP